MIKFLTKIGRHNDAIDMLQSFKFPQGFKFQKFMVEIANNAFDQWYLKNRGAFEKCLEI